MIGDIQKDTPLSMYQPSQDVADLTASIKKDYSTGVQILQRSYVELNDRSIIEDQNRGQLMLNAFVDTSEEDPNEAWKWRGTRSMARNKGVAMHAQLTANYLLPLFLAQNEDDDVDRDMSEVMSDIVDWLVQPTNSDYMSSFIQVVFGMEANPVTFMGAEWYEVYQTIKRKNEDGGYTKEEVLDDVLSGFKAPIYGATEVLINNAYERNIQRQKCLIKREMKDYDELEAKYGDHPNWDFVQAGIRSIYNEEDGLFYDIKDDDSVGQLLSEEIYQNRRQDAEVPMVNGIYLGDEDIESNPIRHRDHRGAPKYNMTPFGFHRIGEHFFYYKSMMNSVGWDNQFYDAMDEILMNRAILEVEMPIAISGTDQVNSDVIFPKSVVSFEDKDTRIMPLLPPANAALGFRALDERKQSIEDQSLNDTMTGQLPDASQKAFNVQRAETNAKKMIGAVGKALAESISQFGLLMKDIVINHLTVPEVKELTSGATMMKYKSFALPNKVSQGKSVDKLYKFDESLIGLELTEQEKKYKSIELLKESGYPKSKKSITLVNPELFRKFNYLCKVDVEAMFARSSEAMQPILLALRREFLGDPTAKIIDINRRIMHSVFGSDGDDLIVEPEQTPDMAMLAGGGQPMGKSQLTNQVQNKQISTAVADVV